MKKQTGRTPTLTLWDSRGQAYELQKLVDYLHVSYQAIAKARDNAVKNGRVSFICGGKKLYTKHPALIERMEVKPKTGLLLGYGYQTSRMG